MNRPDDKNALISGAAIGIGTGTARMLADAGAQMILGDCGLTAR